MKYSITSYSSKNAQIFKKNESLIEKLEILLPGFGASRRFKHWHKEQKEPEAD